MIKELFYILVFPGFLFLGVFSLVVEYIDRKLYARLQNRVGPPWFQPFADLIKLLAKEDIVPDEASPVMFTLAPIVALASSVAAFLYIPLWSGISLASFKGDIIVVLYLLTLPTLAFFIGGWYSVSLYSRIGSVRAITQLFAYEIPLFMGVLSPALLADTWSLSGIGAFYGRHPFYWLINVPGFFVAFIALLGKLEKTPFDIPEAETEIVAGAFTEYSGRLLALLRLTLDVETVTGAALLAAVFFPFGIGCCPVAAFGLFMLKVLFIVALLSLSRTVFARLRIDQMISFCWRYLVPLAIIQVIVDILLKGVLAR